MYIAGHGDSTISSYAYAFDMQGHGGYVLSHIPFVDKQGCKRVVYLYPSVQLVTHIWEDIMSRKLLLLNNAGETPRHILHNNNCVTT